MNTDVAPALLPLSLFLKEETTVRHEQLDRRIMAASPFSSRERYPLFVRVQTRLHRVVSPLFQNPELAKLLPGLAGRDRLQAALQDCADLGVSAEAVAEDAAAVADIHITDTAEALGWLYTVEGSNLGAAFLLKHAKESLGLSETFGARHLAGHEEGRGLHWRRFKEALDAIELTDAERARAVAGAEQAFALAYQGVEALLPVVESGA